MGSDLVLLVAGLALLAWAADAFVDGAAGLALSLRLSPVVVGAVVIGFGTSAPELVVSVLAAAGGSLDIAVGNVVGSNVANVTLVAATAALVAPLAVSSPTLRREALISAAAVVAFALALQGGLTRGEGVLLLAGLVLALGFIVANGSVADDPLADDARGGPRAPGRARADVLRTPAGLVGVVVAAQLIVASARQIGQEAGLSEGVVGFTIVAVGTALPELATGVQAARRGQTDLFVGNVLGSNLFNSLAVGGAVALVGPGTADPSLTGLAAGAMVAVALLAWLLLGTRRCLQRWEAMLLLAAYLALLPLL